jgi:hypothetical protein
MEGLPGEEQSAIRKLLLREPPSALEALLAIQGT